MDKVDIVNKHGIGTFKLKTEALNNSNCSPALTINEVLTLLNDEEFDLMQPHYNWIEKHDNVVETANGIKNNWPNVDVRFGGEFTAVQFGYIDTMYILYDENVSNLEEFERYVELLFCNKLADSNHLSEEDEDISIQDGNRNDEELLISTNEFQKFNPEDTNNFYRLWWD